MFYDDDPTMDGVGPDLLDPGAPLAIKRAGGYAWWPDIFWFLR